MSITSTLSPPLARERLVSALAADPPRLDLAALAIATLNQPQLDAAACLHTLDALAARVQVEMERLANHGEVMAGLSALRHVLADIEGFRGNEDDYHSPDNSFLDLVLERKVGLPISLSVLYLEVARRAGRGLMSALWPPMADSSSSDESSSSSSGGRTRRSTTRDSLSRSFGNSR